MPRKPRLVAGHAKSSRPRRTAEEQPDGGGHGDGAKGKGEDGEAEGAVYPNVQGPDDCAKKDGPAKDKSNP
jgi:hypothetical protein